MDISFADNALQVILTDGREIRVPLEWFPKLRDVTPEARRSWRLTGKGIGIHWPDLDEDLSLEGLVKEDRGNNSVNLPWFPSAAWEPAWILGHLRSKT